MEFQIYWGVDFQIRRSPNLDITVELEKLLNVVLRRGSLETIYWE